MNQIQHSKSRQQQIEKMLSTYEGERKQQHQENTKEELVKIRQRVDLMMEVYDDDQESKSGASPIEFFNSLEELRHLFDNNKIKSNFLSKFRVFVVGLQSGFEKKHNILHSLCESLQQLQHKLATDTIHSNFSEINLNDFSLNEALSTLHRSIERLEGIKSAMRNVFEIQTAHLDSCSSENAIESLNIAEEEMKSISNYLNQMREVVAVSNNKANALLVQVGKRDQEIQKLKSLLRPVDGLPPVSNEFDEIYQQQEDCIKVYSSVKKISPTAISSRSQIDVYTPNNPSLTANHINIHDSSKNTDVIVLPPTNSSHTFPSEFASYISQNNAKNLVADNNELKLSHSRHENVQSFNFPTNGKYPLSITSSSSNILHHNLSNIYTVQTDDAIGSDVVNERISFQNAGVHSSYNVTRCVDPSYELACTSIDDCQQIMSCTFSSSVNGHDNTLLQPAQTDSTRESPIPFKLPLILPNNLHDSVSPLNKHNSTNSPIQVNSTCSDSMTLSLREQLLALQKLRLQEAKDYKRRMYSMQEEIDRITKNNQWLISKNNMNLVKQNEKEISPGKYYEKNASITRNLQIPFDVNHPIGITDILHLIIEIHNVFIDVITQTQDNFSENSIISLQSLKFSSHDIDLSHVCLSLKNSLAHLTGFVDTRNTNDEVRRLSPKVNYNSFLSTFGDYFNDLGFEDIFLSIEDSFILSNTQFEERTQMSFFTELDSTQNCKILDQCESVDSISSSIKLYVVALQYFYTKLTILRWRVFTKFLIRYDSLSVAFLSEEKHLREIISTKMEKFKNAQGWTTRQILNRRYFISKQLTEELVLIEKSTGKYFIKPIYSLPNKLNAVPPILGISSLSQKLFKNTPFLNIKNQTKYPHTNTRSNSTKPKLLSSSDKLILQGSNIPRKVKCTSWVPKVAIYSND